MVNVEARIKIKGKQYEISVDLDEALKIKHGAGNITSALLSPNIYYDLKKGLHASKEDLEKAFGTNDSYQIAKEIITKGEVQKTQEFRDEERERKKRQVISMILQNAVDQHGRPYTEERLKSAIEQIPHNFDNKPAEKQMQELVHKLKEIIPIKIEVKRVKMTIPAQFTGQVYGLMQDYKESEEWLSNGSLQVILNIPAGSSIDFFDKINSVTHGAVQSEELRAEE